MSDADIMAALDGWLGDGPPADLTKPEMRIQAQAIPPVNRESFVVSGEPSSAASNDETLMVTKAVTTKGNQTKPVTTLVTTVSAVAKEAATETAPGVATDTKVSRNASRTGFTQALMAKGISGHDADILTCQLMRRNRQLDDRRSCAECASFHAGSCRQRITPIGETTIHTLHRCKGFKHTEMASNSKWPETQ